MIDAYTDTWREIAAKLNEIIEQCRSRLEQNDQSYGESQFLRGRISACQRHSRHGQASGRHQQPDATGITAPRSQRDLTERVEEMNENQPDPPVEPTEEELWAEFEEVGNRRGKAKICRR